MKKKFGRLMCMCLAVVMVFTIFAAFPAYAAGTETWQITAALTAGNPVKMFDGITIEAAENNSFGKGADVEGVTFKGGMKASNNAVVKKDSSTGEITMEGAAYKIVTERSGKLAIAANLPGNTKSIYAKSASDFDNYILEYTNSSGVAEVTFFEFDVTAGETYYFWFGGTKPWVYGATFKELVSKPAKTGDTVTIAADPGSNALLGNVRIDDESVTLTKGEGMRESTFTMPDKDVTVTVDFVSNAVEKEVKEISFDEIKGSNTSENEVYDNLALFDGWNTSIGYADVSWESSNEDVISKSGEVNPKTEDTKVDFTAVFSYQDYPNIFLYRTFNLTVPADADDEGAVKDAAAALTLGDTSAVKKNLELPQKGRRNTTITWSSSNPAIVGADGKVNPSFDEDNTVILTATITRGEAKTTKEFKIVVPKIVPIEFRRAAVSNADGDVVMTPADGCYLSHIVFVNSITNLTGNETIVAAVTTGGETKEFSVNVKESFASAENRNGSETIVYLDKDALPVSADSKIALTAYEDSAKTSVMPQGTYEYQNTVASGATIYVAGDSTACTYPATGSNNRFPQTGWAAVLGDYFTGVTVKDLALSGRSSLDFLKEGNYTTIKNNIKSGDYFIVQFGHNDSKSDDASRYTDPKGDRFTDGSYKKNMTDNYVNLALDKGAYPILTTSISRRKSSDSSLEMYVSDTKELGKELGLPVIDLYGKVNGYINRVGEEKAKDIYNWVKIKDPRFVNCAAGEFTKSQYYSKEDTKNPGHTVVDNTHINYFGAQLISQWFCDELNRLGHGLTGKRNDHITTEADVPSYADTAAAAAEVSAAAVGDVHNVIYEYDDTLGTVNIYTGDEPTPTAAPEPTETPAPAEYKITGAEFADGGLTVNYTTGEGNAVLVVATYSGEAITAVGIYDIDKSGAQTLKYSKPESGETKIFIWKSCESIAPLCEPYTVK